MSPATKDNPLVTTIGERCRMCYACVRECPAKAIRVRDGQAEVIQERCIGCGNCVRMCSQNAKQIRDETAKTFALLAGDEPVAALVAPSFPAEYTDIEPGKLVAMIRALGFAAVYEVSFGADLVAREYKRVLAAQPDGRYIATPCPAVVSYVRKYYPDLMGFLAPIASPMVASARVAKALLGEQTHIAFIGPCIAKKGETPTDRKDGEIDAVLTFAELRDMFEQAGLKQDELPADDDFDPPHGAVGGVFPISGGLLQAAGLKEDLVSGDLVVAEGRGEFTEAIRDFDEFHSDTRLLDILSCQGCSTGVGITNDDTPLKRRVQISRYTKSRLEKFDPGVWESSMDRFSDLDLAQHFEPSEQSLGAPPNEEELSEILERMGKFTEADFLDCGACGYDTCLDHARAVYAGLADSDMCLPYTIEKLRTAFTELEESHRTLESTKEALVKSEKLASMGQLAAGIAHEVNNPLGILLLQANIMLEECEDGAEERDDLKLIVDQANRCKRIISGLLNFARQSRVVREPADLPALVETTIRTLPVEEGIELAVENEMADPIAEVDKDQIVQVLANLLSNAQHAMPEGGRAVVCLTDQPEEVTISISDTGFGIPEENMKKLFDPFFTTKQVGMGTGLGLAVTHGIVKMHRGQISVKSNADPSAGPLGTTFTIKLPRREGGQVLGAPEPAALAQD
jgi:signal transduction histidine kinase/NAD-dependent dihydropyrimidine dehydrogenase PreA subunit